MNQMVRLIEKELQEQHEKALSYAVQYGTGWERADEAYQRLQAFQRSIGRKAQSTADARTEAREAARRLAA